MSIRKFTLVHCAADPSKPDLLRTCPHKDRYSKRNLMSKFGPSSLSCSILTLSDFHRLCVRLCPAGSHLKAGAAASPLCCSLCIRCIALENQICAETCRRSAFRCVQVCCPLVTARKLTSSSFTPERASFTIEFCIVFNIS